jgi:hypothetical protein
MVAQFPQLDVVEPDAGLEAGVVHVGEAELEVRRSGYPERVENLGPML